MDQTARFALPQLSPGQAQKEWYHNEALQRIDMLLSAAVEGSALAAPPAGPPAGACYLVASGASGAWAGHDGALATFTDGGWRFVAPIEGARVLDRASGQVVLRRNGNWEAGIIRAQEVCINGVNVLRDRQPAILDPTGGSVIDAQCRTAVANIIATLRTHGLIA
jgi:hypothetical protein